MSPPTASLFAAGVSPVPAEPAAALRELFGFDSFRPGQEAAVRAALDGRDVLVVMPTGAGKSVCYQLPALMRDDLTIVVSPLVSLMQDQVQALERVAPGRVGLVNAQQDAAANRAVVERARSGELRLLYVAPERFSSPAFVEAIAGARVGLFVVDEAHCVSQWGHDFRPDYFRLADAARWLRADAIVASTATATPQVAADIVERLGLQDAARITTGFDRPNLTFAVVPCGAPRAKLERIVAALSEPGATPAIVYAGTRAGTDGLAKGLAEALGQEVLAYHAGLPREDRAEAQRRFMGGEVDVVVATNAFGMGVDKADVRTVVHETVPPSLEAYYQEAGRGGRDGAPARALLLAAGKDKGLHVFFIQRSSVEAGQIGHVARTLERAAAAGGSRVYDVGIGELAAGDDDADGVRAVVGALARAGVVQPAPAPMDRVRGRLTAPFDARAEAACARLVGQATDARWKQYRAIWSYVEDAGCRRRAILGHFGDRHGLEHLHPEVPCCDACTPAALPPEPELRGTRRRDGAPAVDLESAILAVVGAADPGVGRTRAVEILRGGRSKVIVKHSYDGLPDYGTFDHLGASEVLSHVDALLEAGRLASTGGMYPKLRVVVGQGELEVA